MKVSEKPGRHGGTNTHHDEELNIHTEGRGSFWWQSSPITHVFSYDYPSTRVRDAETKLEQKGRRFKQTVQTIVKDSVSPEDMIRNIVRYVQRSLIHNPIFQPSKSSRLYTLARKLGLEAKAVTICRYLTQPPSLIEDPDLLIELGEARCGQCAKVLCDAFAIADLKSSTLQLNNHIVAEVILNDTSYIIDADAFKNGIFVEVNGSLASKKDVLENPYLVDRFKHTGWMFRRDSIYGYNCKMQKPYSGYIDLYSPEVDGQISIKYGAHQGLYPPGVPKWKAPSEHIILRPGQKIALEYTCEHSERAIGYRVKGGSRSKGYGYDWLILGNLANETTGDVFEFETIETGIEVSLDRPGTYYTTVASIPHYLEEFPSYLWWSDELVIEVS